MTVPRCSASRICSRPGVHVAGSRLTPCLEHLKKGKARKYRNVPAFSEMAGRRFDSQGEREWCEGLLLRQAAREIHGLRFQTTWKLIVNARLVCTYRSDADWKDGPGDMGCGTSCGCEFLHVGDYKGYETPEFRLKAKLFRAVMGFDIEVVRPARKNFSGGRK